ncbi:MAG: hypothetical protein HRU19_17105 [Pseudobacteriovorax sp.]|nr:hypothetical protein [Pseudobacteriovorax sp.]
MNIFNTAILSISLCSVAHTGLAHGAQLACPPTDKAAKPIEVGGQPESVLVNEEFVLASNIGQGPLTQRGDGYVSLIGLDGKLKEKKWLPLKGDSLDSPTGMAIVKNQVYIADINRIAVFDLKSRKSLPSIDLSSTGASFLNDIVAADFPFIYVSATNIKKVFRIDITTNQYEEVLGTGPDFKVPNGLAWYDKKLYVAQNKVHSLPTDSKPNGSVIVVDPDNRHRIVAKSEDFGQFIDGIAVDRSEIIVSDWNSFTNDGVLHSLSLKLTIKASKTVKSNGFADFDLSSDGSCLVTPDLLGGRILFLSRNP